MNSFLVFPGLSPAAWVAFFTIKYIRRMKTNEEAMNAMCLTVPAVTVAMNPVRIMMKSSTIIHIARAVRWVSTMTPRTRIGVVMLHSKYRSQTTSRPPAVMTPRPRETKKYDAAARNRTNRRNGQC